LNSILLQFGNRAAGQNPLLKIRGLTEGAIVGAPSYMLTLNPDTRAAGIRYSLNAAEPFEIGPHFEFATVIDAPKTPPSGIRVRSPRPAQVVLRRLPTADGRLVTHVLWKLPKRTLSLGEPIGVFEYVVR
jgi:hypothetical protein